MTWERKGVWLVESPGDGQDPMAHFTFYTLPGPFSGTGFLGACGHPMEDVYPHFTAKETEVPPTQDSAARMWHSGDTSLVGLSLEPP